MKIPHSQRLKEVTECNLLKSEWVSKRTGQDAEFKAEKYGKNCKNGQKIGVQKISKGKDYASKYGIYALILCSLYILIRLANF